MRIFLQQGVWPTMLMAGWLFLVADDVETTQAKDVTLTDCLQLAIDHNARLRAASEQYLTEEGQAIKLRAILYPTVNAQGLTAPTVLYVQVNEVLYSRAVSPQLRMSRLGRDEAVINYRQTLDDVIFQVRQAFAEALGARKNDALLQDFVKRQSGEIESARQQFDAGRIQRSELLGVQVTQNNLTQQAAGSQLAVTQGLLALDNLLGVALPEGTRSVGELERTIPREMDERVLIAEALRDRMDLQSLESLRLTQQEQILVDLKNAFPTAGFSSNSAFTPPTLGPISNFDLERNYNEPETQRQEGNTQLPLSLYFTWTIFDGGTLAGTGASERAQLESQDVAIDALKRSIPGEVAGALSAVRTERETLRRLDALTPSAEVRKAAELDYEAGRIRQLDLANLQSSILAQDQAHLAAEIRLSLALAALDHALGHGLLTKPTIPASPHP